MAHLTTFEMPQRIGATMVGKDDTITVIPQVSALGQLSAFDVFDTLETLRIWNMNVGNMELTKYAVRPVREAE